MPDYIEKVSEKSFLLHVKVKPNSRKQYVAVDGDVLRIFLKSKALQNKANIELMKIMKEKLGVPSSSVKIVAGAKSTIKTLKIVFSSQISEQELNNKLFL